MEDDGELKLHSINGLSPEEYMRRQDAAEKKVRDKNRSENVLYGVFILGLLLLAYEPLQYGLVAVVAVTGWIVLWATQSTPLGPDSGIPNTRGLPPIFAVGIIGAALVGFLSFCIFIYLLVAGML